MVSEQVIDVPKTPRDRTQQRACDYHRQPQTAEQLVEVPSIVSYSSLHGNVEQNADIPVPLGRGGRGGLQDLRHGQDSTAFGGADHVDIPVPRSGGLRGSRPKLASGASFTGVFAFSQFFSKKREVGSALGVGTGRGLEPIHAASLWLVHGGRGGRVGASDGVGVTG